MLKNIFLLAVSILLSFPLFSQNNAINKSTFYINVFINSNKQVYVESNKTEFSNIKVEIKKIIRNHPFKIDETIVFRIFADENLKLGYISNVNREMDEAFDIPLSTRRYLLNTVQLNIDGKNWFESKNIQELKKE
ncbi:hypothetical protein SAMN04487764_2859 [Gillisia sp. Hel1_33_143]|uniref:hypothetical protein n=1 Tax=Gillisia sp. Hel1_33_143 TaxID=1336796 RepID=UPI000879B7C7|nr:hypothetical protein [Gillisia sp. Hel1_33_143]SDS70999.1 hypothetical protein SAMN04487764_2859 [Gillisia sp. Hel1_33_143]